ncbi:LacI family transcriptional regulator [Bacillus sp. UMB0899]|uniref:LacI family DNA-binding transcriptional regulator n=1 Tax=Metabacillus schmidteae TaxID=2730405 RepID=UPI000C7FE95E|nr:LacI family DNA-binding transcriptional regulator [Metabacillus schmidteae]PMC35914.1 LacI family transcriptional regulator [Bacillus sp. UMB0899]
MATMKDVAKLSGISISTVSRVINNTGYVNEETKEKVIAAIEKLNYSPNQAARSLVRGDTQTIGLIIPDISNPFFPEIARAVEDTVQGEKYSIIVCNSDNDILKVSNHFKTLKQKSVDGIIIAGEIKSNHIQEFTEQNLPLVMIDVNTDSLPVNSVRTDNHFGGKIATKHLIEQGFSRIAHIRGPLDSSTAEDRYKGYLCILKEYGIIYDPTLVQIGDFHEESGYNAMLRLLAHSNPPDAVFVANDLMALGVLEAISEKNAQIGIVGYDDIPFIKYVNPKLTTVKQPIYDIGIRAAQILLETINNRSEKIDYVKELMKPDLKIRQTSLKMR